QHYLAEIKLRNGFECVFIQPYGNNGIRVRASLTRDPTGNELSALLDRPLEGPEGNQGLEYNQLVPFQGNGTLQNGNIMAQVVAGVVSFYRVETNEFWTLLTQEFTDDKCLYSRYYTQEFKTPSFMASFSFTSDPTEHDRTTCFLHVL
ncbi:hypothetical protein OG21DRAFT_1404792, partial [Imleria badia]